MGNTTRRQALAKWNTLEDSEKQRLYKDFVQSGTFTMALSYKDLTGREIEYILLTF